MSTMFEGKSPGWSDKAKRRELAAEFEREQAAHRRRESTVAQAQRLRWEIRSVGGAWQVVRPDGRLQRTFESQREAIAYLTGLRDGTMSVREALATAAVETRAAMRAAELRVAAETSEIAAFQWVTGASA